EHAVRLRLRGGLGRRPPGRRLLGQQPERGRSLRLRLKLPGQGRRGRRGRNRLAGTGSLRVFPDAARRRTGEHRLRMTHARGVGLLVAAPLAIGSVALTATATGHGSGPATAGKKCKKSRAAASRRRKCKKSTSPPPTPPSPPATPSTPAGPVPPT